MHCKFGTPKKQNLVCWSMELKRDSHKCKPKILVVSQHPWGRVWGVHESELQGRLLYVGSGELWSLHSIFILQSSFLWASSAGCRARYPPYRQKIPGFGTKILTFLPPIDPSVAQKSPEMYPSLHPCQTYPITGSGGRGHKTWAFEPERQGLWLTCTIY